MIQTDKPTDAMIEAVARALFDHEWQGNDPGSEFDNNRDYWDAAARAAITAMRSARPKK